MVEGGFATFGGLAFCWCVCGGGGGRGYSREKPSEGKVHVWAFPGTTLSVNLYMY